MQPEIHLNILAIVLAVVGSFMTGFLWYSLLFSKAWRKEMNAEDMQPNAKQMITSLGLNLIGTVLMVWVFAHNIAAWNPLTWGHEESFISPAGAALSAAIFTWLGFYVPQDFNKVSFHGKSWKLFFIDTSYNLASLLVAAFILVLMK